jgi:hypothetical protein
MRVTKTPLHCMLRHTMIRSHGRGAVSSVVQHNHGHIGCSAQFPEAVGEELRVVRHAVLLAEDIPGPAIGDPGPFFLCFLPRAVLAKQRDERRSNSDSATALAFWFLLDNATYDGAAGDRALPMHMDDLTLKVHFGPPQSGQLAAPHATNDREHPSHMEPVVRGSLEEGATLSRRPYTLTTLLRPVDGARLADPVNHDTQVLKRLHQRAMDVSNGLRGQRPAIATSARHEMAVQVMDDPLIKGVGGRG